ncbi:MAG: Ig-like domain-containing protein, partial [Desulfosalsimonadaceae bacterium]|nr:Ig-like domain-containing protein [Desulfosalsimonadaceae bacterium]
MRRLFILVPLLLFLSACSDTQKPAQFDVVSQSPALEAKAVPTNVAISVTFSEAVDPASVNNLNFRLLNQYEPVSGTLQTNGHTVTFTPSKPLFFNSKYTVSVSADIYGASGRLISQPYQWDFTTRDGLWNILTTIPQGSEPNTSRAAIDDNGRVMLSWSTLSGTYFSFLDGGAWTTPVLLGQGGYIHSVVSVNNNYAVFWQVRSGRIIQLYCARYIDGAWQPTEALASVDATAMYVSPTIFSDNSLIMIYWFNGGADGSHAYSRRFINNQGWQADVALTDQTAWYITGFHRSGKAVITWKSPVGDQDMAYAQNYDVNSGWSTPVAIGQYAYLTAHSATVNSSGQSMVAFSTAIDMRIASNTQNSGWTQLQPVYQKREGSFLYSPPQIAMDYLGNVMLVATEHSPSTNR